MTFRRYAIYYTPPPGPLADLGARWLGWDIATGRPIGAPNLDIVANPRRYGFHATLKAPFHLAEGYRENDLLAAVRDFGQTQAPVRLAGLEIKRLGGFVALVPMTDAQALQTLAARCVTVFDPFRAPMSDAERMRKTKPHMSDLHRHNLARWGYAHVMEAFRFHMTLSGPLAREIRTQVIAQAEAHFAPVQLSPLTIAAITLVGERTDGTFKSIEQVAFAGPHVGPKP